MFYTPTPSSETTTVTYAKQNPQLCFFVFAQANIRVSVTKIEFKSYVERIKIFMENIVHLSTTTNGYVYIRLVWDVLHSAKNSFFSPNKNPAKKSTFSHIHIIVIVAFSHTGANNYYMFTYESVIVNISECFTITQIIVRIYGWNIRYKFCCKINKTHIRAQALAGVSGALFRRLQKIYL